MPKYIFLIENTIWWLEFDFTNSCLKNLVSYHFSTFYIMFLNSPGFGLHRRGSDFKQHKKVCVFFTQNFLIKKSKNFINKPFLIRILIIRLKKKSYPIRISLRNMRNFVQNLSKILYKWWNCLSLFNVYTLAVWRYGALHYKKLYINYICVWT